MGIGANTTDPLRIPDISGEEILESLLDPFIAVDSKWNLSYANSIALNNFPGLHQLMGTDSRRSVPDWENDPNYGSYRSVMSSRKAERSKHYSSYLNAYIDVHVVPLKDGIGVFIRNVDEQERTQIELRTNKERYELLYEAGQLLGSTLELSRIYGHLRELIGRVARVDGLVVSSYKPEEGKIYCTHAWSNGSLLDHKQLPPMPLAPDGAGMQSQVIREGRAMLFGDVAQQVKNPKGKFIDVDGQGRQKELGGEKPSVTQCAIMVPVKLEGQVRGVVQVMSDSSGAYTQGDLDVLQGIVNQFAVAIQNAMLYETAREEIAVRERIETALRESESMVRRMNADLEEMVRERTAELETANRDMQDFTYSVSHDLRAPLRSIVGSCRMLQEDYGPSLPAEALGHLDRLIKAANKMAALVDDLLKLSRLGKEQLKRSHVNLTKLAYEVCDDLREDGAHASFYIEEDMIVEADPALTRLLVQNLLQNAAKFHKRQAEAQVVFGRQGQGFFVRDNGIGIPREYMNKIFLPFERLHHDGDYPGTGIGLAIVLRIAERHGGRVWAESEEGKGSTFYFRL